MADQESICKTRTSFSSSAASSLCIRPPAHWLREQQQQQQQQQQQEQKQKLTATKASSCIYQNSKTSLLSDAPLLVSSKFHRAAIDGYVDMLCDASRRETNAPAKEHHMLTPTLLAAQSGQLEALRILVGRGGDPECVSSNGLSALHLAAARNHLNCVSFLVNFGVNMWALDNDLRTAKDLAAIEQCKEVLDYLDQMMAKHSAINTKQVQKLKEKAKQAAEKRLKQVRKAQLKAIKQVERDERQLAKLSHQRRLLKAAHSISDIKLVGRSSHELRSSCASAKTTTTPQQTIASYINQRLQADLLARARRSRTAPMRHQHQVDATTKQQQHKRNCATTVGHSDQESFSSVSSTSGYLSSCSAKSVLKQVANNKARVLSDACLQSTTKSPNRPKYSDLVALNENQTASPAASLKLEPRVTRVGTNCDQASTSSSSSFALRLRAISGGVSRKVQLKKLLNVATQVREQPSWPRARTESSANQPKETTTNRSSGILKRARSEPDFDAPARLEAYEISPLSSSEEEKEDDDDNDHVESPKSIPSRPSGSEVKAPLEPEPCRRPPSPPTPPPLPINSTQKAEQQQHSTKQQRQEQLLNQCLSQLKLQHETTNQQRQAATGKQKLLHQFGVDSDELIRHQMNAGEFPLRPSIIKHQQKHLGGCEQRCDKSASAVAIHGADSLDSANCSILISAKQSQSVSSCASTSSSSLSDASGNHSRCSVAAPKQISLEEFLNFNGLSDLRATLERERIDWDALKLLSEDDLRSLNILLGPRRKLLNAIKRHEEKPFLMVDTQF